MGKYPFGEYASRYMDSVRGVYAEETWKTRARRYRRMERRIIELKEQKRISTMSPKSMTEGDVREYLLHCKEILAPSDMVHEVNALRNLLSGEKMNPVQVTPSRFRFRGYTDSQTVFEIKLPAHSYIGLGY